jgi:hypothetical protein
MGKIANLVNQITNLPFVDGKKPPIVGHFGENPYTQASIMAAMARAPLAIPPAAEGRRTL